MSRIKLKIRNVTKSNFLDLRHILSESDYAASRKEFKKTYGFKLPYIKDVYDANVDHPFFILLNNIDVGFDEEISGVRYVYKFKKGAVIDLASVPKILQSIVQNDDVDAALASMVHDYNFRTWYFGKDDDGFKIANIIFEQMIEEAEKARGIDFSLKSELFYGGVRTRIAKELYYQEVPIFLRNYCKVEKFTINN